MAAHSADASERNRIRHFAADPSLVRVTRTTQYDLLGHNVSKEEICDEIVAWIDESQKVKKVMLRGEHAGSSAFEMKPRINDQLFYLKVMLCDVGGEDDVMLLISAHPDH